MVAVMAGTGTKVRIMGHGLKLHDDFALVPGITISPITMLAITDSFGTDGIASLKKNFGALAMEPLANFSVLIEEPLGGQVLATKAWNALWIFSLLALSCRAPVISLYCVAEGTNDFTLANRNLIINPLPNPVCISTSQLQWAADHCARFNKLVDDERFRSSQRYYNNSHYLADYDARLMLLWAGIEGILDVQAELRHRIALHAAILLDGDAKAKSEHFSNVKKAYDIRSKVVHGSGADAASLNKAYEFTSRLLIGLLRKCVELGRVPPASELDQLAASAVLTGTTEDH